MKYIPIVNKTRDELDQTNGQIMTLGIGQTDLQKNINTSINKINGELNSRLNDQVWNSKFENYHEKQIKPIIQKLEETLKNSQTKFD